MRDLEPDRLFQRYRATGDPGALAALFDRTAPELLKLARLLVRDRTLADDLLQATFVTAIEKAQWFDGTRRIEPWLVGILAKHAANTRRKQNRFLDADRLGHGTTSDPHTDAERREFAAEVERALAGLPAIYREVLEPKLRHERGGDEIARDLGRSPGVVRMQITRGLALLKQILPHGLTALTFGALLSKRSLAAARHAVLEHAVAHAPAPVAASAAQTAAASVVGGIVVSKLPVISVAALVLAASAWLVLHDDEAPPALVTTTDANDVAHAGRSESTVTAPPVATPSADASRNEVPSARIDDLDVPRATWPAAVDPDLARIEGRVLEADGRPVAGVEVTLFEVEFGSWIGVLDATFDRELPIQVEVAHTRTGADGRFVLPGADASATHALGIDLGAERSTLRVVDRALRAGVSNDVGDVVLGGGIALSGTVVDEAGEPLAGARVRVVAVPLPIGSIGLHHLTSSSVFMRRHAESTAGALTVMSPPRWLARLIDRLPVPTTTSGADGTFRFPAVPIGSLSVVVDRAGYVAACKGPFPSGTTGRDVGSIEMTRGRTVTGNVVDAAGRPVPDAEVVLGVMPEVGGIVVARRCGRTDANGRFTAPNVPEFHDVFAAARRSAREPWMAPPAQDADELTIELPTTVTLELVVLDARGAAIDAPEFLLRPRQEARLESVLLGNDADLRVHADPIGDGHHEIRDLLPAIYELTVRASGFATAMFEVDASGASKPVEVRLVDERVLTTRVLAADGGAPIEAARVSAFRNGESRIVIDAITRVFTDASGNAVLRGLPIDESVVLVVERPGFARVEEPVGAGTTEFEVSMHRGGAVEGRVLLSGSPPSEPLMVAIVKENRLVRGAPQVPSTSLTDGRGEFALQGLPDGEYQLEIHERLLAGEPASWFERFSRRVEPLYHAQIGVNAGKVTRLDLDLVAPGSSAAAAIRGRVTIDGEPQRGSQVQITHAQGNAWIELDDRGEFALDAIAPGRVEIQLFGVTKRDDGFAYEMMCRRTYDVAAGQTEFVELDLVSTTVRVHVRTSGGTSVDGASVSVSGTSESARGLSRFGQTDASGTAELRVLGTGTFHVFAEHDEAGVGSTKVDLPGADVEITLDPGVPCAGSFTLALGVTSNPNMSHHVEFRGTTESKDTRFRSVMLPSPNARTFSVAGLGPGEYAVTFRCGPDESAPIVFTLPPEGATDLEFEFQRAK